MGDLCPEGSLSRGGSLSRQWRIQDFRISPRRGCQLPRGAPTYDFIKFSQNCMKLKEFGPLLRSATARGGSLSRGGSLCRGESLSGGFLSGGGLCQGDPPVW